MKKEKSGLLTSKKPAFSTPKARQNIVERAKNRQKSQNCDFAKKQVDKRKTRAYTANYTKRGDELEGFYNTPYGRF